LESRKEAQAAVAAGEAAESKPAADEHVDLEAGAGTGGDDLDGKDPVSSSSKGGSDS